MYSCKIDFHKGLVFLGHTVLDGWTDEVFMKRIFRDMKHTHDFTGAAVYEAPIEMRMDKCNFNRLMVVMHKKRLDLPPVIKEIYFFMDKRPDWANNELFRLVQSRTKGPAVRPGSLYQIDTPYVHITASDAIGSRGAHIRFRYDNAEYSYNRRLTPEQLKVASIRAGVVRINGEVIYPGIPFDVKLLMRSMRNASYLASDFVSGRAPDKLEGKLELRGDNEGHVSEILFHSYDLSRTSLTADNTWLNLHLGDASDNLIVHTPNGRLCFTPFAGGMKIRLHPASQ